jgi:AcrR family transcriptional regulator
MSNPANSAPNPERRNPERQQAILASALTLLAEHGYHQLTIEGIAKRAGVGKQTIYRWWPNKAALILEAYGSMAIENTAGVDSGSLRADLQQFLSEIAQAFSGLTGHAARSLLAETAGNSDFRYTMRQQFVAERRATLATMLRCGQSRGELPANFDFELALDLFYGALWYRLLLEMPLDGDYVARLIEMVVGN